MGQKENHYAFEVGQGSELLASTNNLRADPGFADVPGITEISMMGLPDCQNPYACPMYSVTGQVTRAVTMELPEGSGILLSPPATKHMETLING